jgi:hypothetical protein
MEPSYLRLVGGVGAVLLLAVAVFQVLLALGLPFGEAAWGGGHRVLPRKLRVASAVAGAVWAVAALTVLERGGVLSSGIGPAVTRPAVWVLTALLALGTLMNAISRSRIERLIWTPVAAGACAACLTLSLFG